MLIYTWNTRSFLKIFGLLIAFIFFHYYYICQFFNELFCRSY